MSDLDCKRLKALLTYSKKTGVFLRRVMQGNQAQGNEAGCLDSRGYVRIRIDGISYGAHRLAWFYVYGTWPEGVIDHKNGIKSDNRLRNLRDVPQSTNMQNVHRAKRNNPTKLLGAFCVGKKFRAAITTRGKTKVLGEFKTALEAHHAYMKAKKEMHRT